MSVKSLTSEEMRNLEVVDEWLRCWNTKGMMVKMVDEIYADSVEVFTPIQNKYYVRKNGSKQLWRKLEILLEKLIYKREMRIVKAIAKDNMVVFEAIVSTTTLAGSSERWISAFLTFDEKGRVICDHTYIPLTGFEQLVDKQLTRFLR